MEIMTSPRPSAAHRSAKVDELHGAVVGPRSQDDVLRLDVAVADADRVQVVDSLGHLSSALASKRRRRSQANDVARSSQVQWTSLGSSHDADGKLQLHRVSQIRTCWISCEATFSEYAPCPRSRSNSSPPCHVSIQPLEQLTALPRQRTEWGPMGSAGVPWGPGSVHLGQLHDKVPLALRAHIVRSNVIRRVQLHHVRVARAAHERGHLHI